MVALINTLFNLTLRMLELCFEKMFLYNGLVLLVLGIGISLIYFLEKKLGDTYDI